MQDTDSRGDVPVWDSQYVCVWEISVLPFQFFCGPKTGIKIKSPFKNKQLLQGCRIQGQ